MQGVSGKLMDWLGVRKGFSLIIVWWSAAGMLHAAAGSALQLGIFRFLLGMGEAGNWPGAVKAISEWFPPRERAFAVGFFNSGSALGAIIAPPLVTWIMLTHSWRVAYVVTGLLGFLWLAAWLILYRSPREHSRVTDEELKLIEEGAGQAAAPATEGKIRWRDLLKYKQVWGLMLARSLADPVWWFYVFWMPEYLKRGRGFTLAMIGLFAWIPFLTADIGNFFGGGLSGLLIKRKISVTTARKVVMAASALLMTSGIFAVGAESGFASIALISLVTFAYSCWAANILTLPADIFPSEVVGSAVGLSGTAGGLGGMIFTLITGWVVDHFSYTPIFTAAAAMPLVAALFVVLFVVPQRTEKRYRMVTGSEALP